jgi:hypothetical protein
MLTNHADDPNHWVKKMYADADSLDTDAAMSWLDAAVVQRMGSFPPNVGVAAAREGYEGMLGAVTAMKHHFIGVWDVDAETTIAEANVTYDRKDGQVITLPATTILRHRDHRVFDLRIYMDPSPLHAA